MHSICIMVVWRKNKKIVERLHEMKKKIIIKWWWKVKAHERQIKKEMRSLGWKTQKFTPGRLRMESVFEYRRVSFGESLRTTMYCIIVYYISTCILLIIENCWTIIIMETEMFRLIKLWWNVYFVYTWTLVITN